MADEKPKVKRKVRAGKYEEKAKFDGTPERTVSIAVKPKNTSKKAIKLLAFSL
jgi:hypothetical protein